MGFGSTTDKGDPKKNILPDVLKEPQSLTDADADMKTLDQLRGIAGDMKKGFETMHEAKLSLNEKATVEGVMVEMDVMRQKMEMQAEQMNRLIGMYATLSDEFKQYREQRVVELQSWLAGGGSTTPEDHDGDHAQPRD